MLYFKDGAEPPLSLPPPLHAVRRKAAKKDISKIFSIFFMLFVQVIL
jgi:hypothetical protein